MCCTHFMGLNPWAHEFLKNNERLLYIRQEIHIFSDGTEKSQPDEEVKIIPKIATHNRWEGMSGDGDYLYKYTLLDGTKVTEYIQASPWSSGPCIFLALKYETGNSISESLWDDKEINSC